MDKHSDQPQYGLKDLLYLMQRLRKPDSGCPWDIAQNYRTIAPSTIEEAYEVVDAIERDDYLHLKEELGDLLFQVVFYSQLGEEDGYFDFYDIIDALTEKLLRRHPHVFPLGTLASERDQSSLSEVEKVKELWEKIKAEEREKKGNAGIVDDVPVALPSLQRAQKLQKRVAKAGMDFRSLDAVLEKIVEEAEELKDAVRTSDDAHIEDELGDVLFCCVNLARHLRVDADTALRKANTKFESRIRNMEVLLSERGLDWKQCDDNALDELWVAAKVELGKQSSS